ncbi:hypothetical protein DCAR_0934827 [Daucus carota subsp. sativus]|uniref:Uncharacterized protein n=1 Tax=Daucus carota subsp. sativus TaxID=79200 RepID=A0AAF1BDC7_DAUCS|nr:hypothetical protein DCAR_0934827 [Daucus carota subsp. sativus]
MLVLSSIIFNKEMRKKIRDGERESHFFTIFSLLRAYSTPTMLSLVTGANKGIGFETVRQLAISGVTVILTARDVKRGTDAVASLALPNVVFHQLDVQDDKSIHSLVSFIYERFGRLDILLSGQAMNVVQGVVKTSYHTAKQCLDTNYYGVKRVTGGLLPLLELSTYGGRIVNVSSLRSELRRIPSDEIRKELGDIETLTEQRIDKIVDKFFHDLKHDMLEANGWPMMLPAYSISKATLNAYTRVLAKKYPNMCINCVHPGYVDTDINWHTGTMTVEQGAKGSVMLALLPDGGPSGCYFDQTQVAEF